MSSWLVTKHGSQKLQGDDDARTFDEHDESEMCREDSSIIREDGAITDGAAEEEWPEPSAEHLMVDIKNVDGAFLNSETRLARAIINLVNEADLPLLSYHCHKFSPVGVSCVGVLLRNYLAFHTWPEEGVITFDLVTAESKSILPLLPLIERLFGVTRAPSFVGQIVKQPEMRWAFKLRGFRPNSTEISNLFQVTDLGDVLSILGTDFKKEVSWLGL